ncbi:hypothetical protein Tco_0976327 [Tanacetum coccineum]|uniref:Uncharacterized protein n=1 Tax=Tanacetum coccineum TaxID=301880 RepID=A0ABQ5EGX9_9ASTR
MRKTKLMRPQELMQKLQRNKLENVQTSLTLSSAELEIQSMVDVPIHQEDPAVQRTSLIDNVISMVIENTTSTPTPPTTQAQVQIQNRRDLPRDIPLDSVEVLSDNGNPSRANIKPALRRSDKENKQLRSVLMEPEIHVKMEMEIPRSSKVKFITACSYSIDKYKDMMKAQIHVTQVFHYSDT